jgi:hypothetical protein
MKYRIIHYRNGELMRDELIEGEKSGLDKPQKKCSPCGAKAAHKKNIELISSKFKML